MWKHLIAAFLFLAQAGGVAFGGVHHASNAGLAWSPSGNWYIGGERQALRSGDAIPPGALLQTGDDPGSHSLMVLFPDGQNVMFACFSRRQCARGFRVPQLYREPDAFGRRVLTRVQAILTRGNRYLEHLSPQSEKFAPQEALAVLEPGNRVRVAGLAATLRNGRYTYDLQPLHAKTAPSRHHLIEKQGHAVELVLPAPGLYDVTIFDDLQRPRIELFLAAVRPSGKHLAEQFSHVRDLLIQWKEDYPAWPIHELARAWLESVVLGIAQPASAAPVHAGNRPPASDRTAEPVFSPESAILGGRTEISIRCATPGAVIHYSQNGIDPSETSPVYSGPIVVMGTEATIKAFAAAPGKKDSPVVTAEYRVPDEDPDE